MAFFEITRTPWGYYIEKDGKAVRGPYDSKGYVNGLLADFIAADRIDAKKTAKAKFRPCITCSEEFKSEGPHNRMCDTCRRTSADVFQGAV